MIQINVLFGYSLNRKYM